MEEKYCVLIIGAGLAGLSCAKYLMEHGLDDFIIIEAQNRIGGRCQTIQYSMFVDEK
jgi:monoamine oxidase